MENRHLQWIFPLTMVIFNSYVSLPEGIVRMGRTEFVSGPEKQFQLRW